MNRDFALSRTPSRTSPARMAAFAALCIMTFFAFNANAQSKSYTSISGTVVDTGCYVSHDSKGEAHAKCAAACAKNGVPLAILDDHGTLYMPIAVEHKDKMRSGEQNAR